MILNRQFHSIPWPQARLRHIESGAAKVSDVVRKKVKAAQPQVCGEAQYNRLQFDKEQLDGSLLTRHRLSWRGSRIERTPARHCFARTENGLKMQWNNNEIDDQMIRDLNKVSFISFRRQSFILSMSLRSSRPRIGSNFSEFCTTVAPFRTAMATGSLQWQATQLPVVWTDKIQHALSEVRRKCLWNKQDVPNRVFLRCFVGPKCQLTPKETETQFPRLLQMKNWIYEIFSLFPYQEIWFFAVGVCDGVAETSKAMPPKAKPKIGVENTQRCKEHLVQACKKLRSTGTKRRKTVETSENALETWDAQCQWNGVKCKHRKTCEDFTFEFIRLSFEAKFWCQQLRFVVSTGAAGRAITPIASLSETSLTQVSYKNEG